MSENKANNNQQTADITEINTRLEEGDKRMGRIEGHIRVLNDAHVKNEADHTEIKLALNEIKTQIGTVVKVISFIVSATVAVVALAQFILAHWC